ncbi:ethylbenzene dehydrogenase-related protein [Aestuariirhabdus litorea]|uniref:Ethylbenzene dehydrogenase n=1 Tax=Aestuariirhabdus litorea TaxID=2528527 RepID=A0A3P3VRD4_9GAMM|nr:ethylbenzene dehydrogenase-related protein [Aestuariirhabdus litorea]RRJ84246.1 ethylbenzene dehydrogenase [Aestuariirhabdus litorea]RWW97468.1 ethylbenzene dehydrogenase [Endozoicomonadaceae bacterium GTF-13]
MNTFSKTSLALACASSMLMLAPASYAADSSLVSVKTSSSITLDGMAENAWDSAKTLSVRLDNLPYKPDNYKGMTSVDVNLKSLYDDQFVYFLIQYKDPTKSLMRYPWEKQADGSWKQLKDKDHTGHDNVYYEDKLALLWDINARGFGKKGCDAACHMQDDDGKINGIDQKGKAPGRKYTRKDQTIDMWHWKSVRMNPVGVIDDQYIDSVNDPAVNKNWGRHGDAKTGGGYVNNMNEAKDGPAFMNRTQDGLNDFTITPDQKTEFVDTFKPGDMVPGIMSTAFTGSRGDIWAKGAWKEGMWTIEIKRKLVTTGEKADIQDVQFSDLGKAYSFGVSVFDNSQINHIYHEGVLKLSFQK